MKETEQLFPIAFLSAHRKWLDGKALNVLWCYMQDPEATIREVAQKTGLTENQVEHANESIRREWDTRRTPIAVMRAIAELESMSENIVGDFGRKSAGNSARISARHSVEKAN